MPDTESEKAYNLRKITRLDINQLIRRRRRTKKSTETRYGQAIKNQNRAFLNMFDNIDGKKGWINKLKRNATTGGSRATYLAYKFRSIYFLEWIKKEYKKHPFALKISDALSFQEYLQEIDTTHRGNEMNNFYRNMILDSVRNMYDYFVLKGAGYLDTDDELIKMQDNPFKRIPNLPIETKIAEKYLSDANITALEEMLNSMNVKPYYKVAFILGLNAGLRISEVVNVEYQDVSKQKSGDKEVVVIRITSGKGRKQRDTIYIEEATQDELVEYTKSIEENYVTTAEKLKAGEIKLTDEQLLRYRKLVPIGLTTLNKFMYRLGKKMPFNFHFHRLRHTFAHRLSQKGVPIETIAHVLGHATIETTRIYAEVDTERAIKDLLGSK